MKNTLLQSFRVKAKLLFDNVGTERLRRNVLIAIPFWVASLITGLVAVGYTKLFGFAELLLQRLLHFHEWLIFLAAPICFLLSWIIVQRFAPAARGSGIPQIMAAIQLSKPGKKSHIEKLLSIRIAVSKIFSSFFMVLGGGAIGREGPTIQIAGSVFKMISSVIPVTWPKLSKQSFILTGAAAGLAAAFNTPLGGVVFAMEELARIHVRFFRTALFSAVIIAGLTAQGLLGPYLYLGYPDVGGLKFSIFAAVALAAVIGGAGGSLMCKGILGVMKWKSSFSTQKIVLFIVCAGLLTASLSYLNKEILGSGKDIMSRTLFTSNKETSIQTALLRALGPIISFNIGGAGGVFAPALAAGAALGSCIASTFHFFGANANILILSGMVGFLTGVTGTPFTSAILVLEMTDRHNVIFHLMLAALLSNLAAIIIDKHSLYERLKITYLKEADPLSEYEP